MKTPEERDRWSRTGAIAILTVLAVSILIILTSCAASHPPASASVGTVIQVDGDRVLVTFPVLSKGYADQAVNWFVIPGHSYGTGDRYPDTSKDPNLKNPSKP